MPKITVDAALRDQLVNLQEEVTLYGPDGTAVGFFMPMERSEPQIDEAESRRRIADTTSKRYTTAEVIAHLESL